VRSSRRGPRARRRRWGAPGCLAAALAAAALLCAPALAADAGPLPFCGPDEAEEREARLAAMPGARPAPEGPLPFGPRNFNIHKADRTAVVLEGSRIGYRFGAKNGYSRELVLNWRLGATLRRVDSAGRVKRALGRRHVGVGKVDDLEQMDLLFPAEHPGLYRIDTRIRDLSSGKRVSYREYFEVLKRSVDVSIAVSVPSARPGEAVYGRVVNRGGTNLTGVPAFLDVEREQGSTWVPVEQPPTPASVLDFHWWMHSGEATYCSRFDVPSDATPGRYRFTASIYVVNLQRRETFTGGFEVAP